MDASRPKASRLHRTLVGSSHTLLLFDGAAATPEGYRNLAGIARAVAAQVGDRVTSHIVVPGAAIPDALDFDGPVLQDVAGLLHEAYCASTECLYLIRPDGDVGFRSQPATLEALQEHLTLIFG